MKTFSVQHLFRTAGLTLRRFPMTIMAAAGGSVMGILIPQFKQSAYEGRLWLLLMMFAITIPASFALTTFSERRKTPVFTRVLLMLLLAVLLALFYFTGKDHTLNRQLAQFLLLNTAALLLVSFTPFLGTGNLNGFWHYNIMLLNRFLVTTFFSLVLYVGITLAIFALNHLFGMNLDVYEELWFFTIGIFHTWFFLSGITTDYDAFDGFTDYPRGLKIFTQYVLLPLLSIYLLILYAYLFKILLSRQFPADWVLNLVLGFSITGMLALLLIHPLQEQAGNRWVRIFGQWFFPSLLPPVVMLFLAILRRISDFGFTENRYVVLVIAAWLAGMALFFIIRKFRYILIIPVSLCVVALLAGLGPWSAFSVSEKSQQKKLNAILSSNNLLQDGKVAPRGIALPEPVRAQITSIVDYLATFHGAGSLQPFFTASVDSMAGDMHNGNEEEAVAERAHQLMGMPYVKQRDRSFTDEDGFTNFSFSPSRQPAVEVSGYDHLLPLRMQRWNNDTMQRKTDGFRIFPAGDDTFHVWLGANGRIVFNSVQGSQVVFDLKPIVDQIRQLKNRQETDQLIQTRQENEHYELLLVFSRLSGKVKDDALIIRELNAELLVKRKDTIQE